jgi:hypothetical protein
MKTLHLIAPLAALLCSVTPRLAAGENLRLETMIYVFRQSDFHTVAIPGAVAASNGRGVVLQPPATAQFDQETLSLDGPRLVWSGNHPPERFDLVAAPTTPITAGQPVTLLSTAAVQYLEKLPNGTLEVRQIPGDSPDAPHCRLTFTVNPAGTATKDLLLACDLDIATVQARERLSGVALEVGKPVLARLQEKLQMPVRPETWSGVLLQTPNDSDYSLLVLLKVAPMPAANGLLTKVGNFHLHTERFGAAAVADGRYVYIIGGMNRGGILGDIERFDVRTHEITTLTDRLTPRHHHGAVLVNGKIYMLGGHTYGWQDETQIYDLATGKITQGTPLPWPRYSFATAALGGKIYVMGGRIEGDDRLPRRMEIYDIASNSWTEGSPMPTPRVTSAAVVSHDMIIVPGGYARPATSVGVKTVEAYLPGKNQWVSLPDLAQPVSAHSAALLGNSLFLFGNYDPPDTILAYDLVTHASTIFKDGFKPASHTAAVAHDGLIYVIGGIGAGDPNPFRGTDTRLVLDDIQVFAPAPTADH